MIAGSLRDVGTGRSVVIDENNVLMAGNGVVQAASEVGITRVRVIEAAGDELIAVRRSGLTEEQKRALAIADNRAAELAEWNYPQLEADIAAGLDLQPYWTPEEVAKMKPPEFLPTPAEEQGRLDETPLITCPSCGHAFHK